jgi:cell division septation protein DedD
MARQRSARGLTVGQLLSLTLGFLIASVVIFVFGMWVGSDLAKQQLTEDRQIVRLEVATHPATATLPFVFSTPTPPATPATPTQLVPRPSFTSTPYAIITTPTQARPMLPWAATPTAQRKASPASAAGSGWTVQVAATTDLAEALKVVQRLRANGYDAYTRQRQIAGATWYRVRVGQFETRAAAKRLEEQLRRELQLDAAYVTQE